MNGNLVSAKSCPDSGLQALISAPNLDSMFDALAQNEEVSERVISPSSSIFDNLSYTNGWKYASVEDATMARHINELKTLKLNSPLRIDVERDAPGYIATVPNLGVLIYSYGDTILDATSNLQSNLESLYRDLEAGKIEFSPEWIAVKNLLERFVVNA